MDAGASRRQRLFSGIAAMLVLALAFWLFLGRSPSGGPHRIEVALGSSVRTDLGTVTVSSLDDVPEGTNGAPAPEAGHAVRAIRFRSCRTDPGGTVVDLSQFSVGLPHDRAAAAAGSRLSDTTAECASGLVFVQVPQGLNPTDVEYAADPVAVWSLPHR